MNENQRPARSTRPARILVADDETLVRRTLEHLLTRMGHQVSAVGSGLEALHRLEAEAFDLVLTDLSMPGMGGIAVVRAVRRQHPSTKVAVLTGYAPDTELEEGLKEAHAVVHKPVGLADLSEALVDLLGEG